MKWLDEAAKQSVRKIFEPRYKRQLSDAEIEQIAVNLTVFLENILRFKTKNAK